MKLFGRHFLVATPTRPRKELGFSFLNMAMAGFVGVCSGVYIFLPLVTDIAKFQRESIELREEQKRQQMSEQQAGGGEAQQQQQ